MNLQNQYLAHGFVVCESLLSVNECDQIVERAHELHQQESIVGCFNSKPDAEDPLEVYPRMMHPHRVDPLSLYVLRHPKIVDQLETLLGEPAVGLQTMIYWKPPQALGQALHQDDFYLQTQPYSCIAAWVALEKTDAENGALMICPGSHLEPILEMKATDPTLSFTHTAVRPNPQYSTKMIEMEKGDILFFHGRLIHGSLPNRSVNRFRKTFICHYIPKRSTSYNKGYDPKVELR